ncbi:MAG: 4Fe-4S binding protein [bacterium]
MGHLAGGVYHQLQHRLDRYPVGAPESKELYEILRILYSEEEAALAARMPMAPKTLKELIRVTRLEPVLLKIMLEGMAGKGLVMDIEHPATGETYYMLSPTVVGFFEFSLMRKRSDMPQKRIAELMHDLLHNDDVFARELFQQTTQVGRTLAHEAAMPPGVPEILDYEKASEIIKTSTNQAVSLCYCRHKNKLVGKECGFPLEICTSLNLGADFIIKNKLGRQSSKSEMMDILDQSFELGLVNVADNVQKDVTFICHCCSCCCGMLVSLNKFEIPTAIMTSNFVASVDKHECKGCKKCAKKCPVNAVKIKVIKRADRKKKYRWAEVDQKACLGCGVCVGACDEHHAMGMKPRRQRVIPPRDTFDRTITMALERGKLHEYIFDGDKPPIPGALRGLVKTALRLPPTKKLLLSQQVKSRFMKFLLERDEASKKIAT